MSVELASPGRLAIAAVPAVGFLATPFLPFVNTADLWFGVPAVLVWSIVCVFVTVAAMQIVDYTYVRAGGADVDRAELAEQDRAMSVAANDSEGA